VELLNEMYSNRLAKNLPGNSGKRENLFVFILVISMSIIYPISYVYSDTSGKSQNSYGNEIAVFDFNDINGKPQLGLGVLVADILSETLTKSKKVKVRNRNELLLDLNRNNCHFLIPPYGTEILETAQKLKLRYAVTGKVLNYEIIAEENKKWFGSRAVDFFISIQYSVFDAATNELLVSERIDDIIKKRVAKMPELENPELNRPFMESVFFPVVARIAIKINNAFEQ
jgi:hypothetical protein